VNFIRRFRIVIRRWLYFQREVSDLGPAYLNCSIGGNELCSGPRKNPRFGCPKCEYTLKYKHFEEDCEKDFRKGLRDRADNHRWPLNMVMRWVGTVSRANRQTKRGTNPRWSVLIARLVDIYREEISRVSFIDSWNQKQEMQAMMQEIRASNRRGHYDDDYGED
jgi:hypothetical protein